jgi:hypothetical protein
VKEGDDADAEVANSQKKTTSRRELSRNPRFEQVSPEVGELDESAVEDAMADDPDEMLAMLADLVGATDRTLRELAKRLAGKLFIDLARRGPVRPRGVGQLRELPYRPDGGDLDDRRDHHPGHHHHGRARAGREPQGRHRARPERHLQLTRVAAHPLRGFAASRRPPRVSCPLVRSNPSIPDAVGGSVCDRGFPAREGARNHRRCTPCRKASDRTGQIAVLRRGDPVLSSGLRRLDWGH